MDGVDDEHAELVAAYRRYYELKQGDRRDRLAAEEHWWAWERVNDAILAGDVDLAVLDALVADADGDVGYLGWVAAGPLEDLLSEHPDAYAAALAERCRIDPQWAAVLRGVWLDEQEWKALPDDLRRVIRQPHGR